jgi:uncharacterized metal-binding protein
MGMQTDVLASQTLTATGQIKVQGGANLNRARVKAIYVVPDTIAGSAVFRDGGATGKPMLTVDTLASATSPTYMLIPDQGLLFEQDIHVTLTDVASVMVFYG